MGRCYVCGSVCWDGGVNNVNDVLTSEIKEIGI